MPTRKNQKKRDRKRRLKAAKKQMALPDGSEDITILPPHIHGYEIVQSRPGELKMSDVLWEFIEPYVDKRSHEDDIRHVLTLGMLAWNNTLVQDPAPLDVLQPMVDKLPADHREQFRMFFNELMLRKTKYFAHIRRLMFQYTLTMTPDGPYLQVFSSESM